MRNWISVEEELPPCDGLYEVTNRPDLENQEGTSRHFGIFIYDGYGFEFERFYRPIKYWRFTLPRVKRYGKIDQIPIQ